MTFHAVYNLRQPFHLQRSKQVREAAVIVRVSRRFIDERDSVGSLQVHLQPGLGIVLAAVVAVDGLVWQAVRGEKVGLVAVDHATRVERGVLAAAFFLHAIPVTRQAGAGLDRLVVGHVDPVAVARVVLEVLAA
jgi:hypothetical protein